jgi:hypothetical protein
MKRSLQFFVAMILFVVGLFAILAITDQWMISKTIETCPAQFPKWIGCVLANHENLSGSLITAGGALFAAWIAWHAVMDQIESDKAMARNAERPIVHGGPGWRRRDAHGRDEGIIFTGQNTGKTTAFPNEIYWGACTEDEWSTIGKHWPQIETAKHEKWETPLPPNMTNDKLIGAEFTFTPIPHDGKNYVCYGTIVYTNVYGKKHTTSWKHSVVSDGARLKTEALEGAYSSEWDADLKEL